MPTVAVWKVIKKPAGTELDPERWYHVRDVAFVIPGDAPHVPTANEALLWAWYWVPDLTLADEASLREPVMETVGLETRVKTPRKKYIDSAILRDSLTKDEAAIDDALMDPKTAYNYAELGVPELDRNRLAAAVRDKTVALVKK